MANINQLNFISLKHKHCQLKFLAWCSLVITTPHCQYLLFKPRHGADVFDNNLEDVKARIEEAD